MEPVEVTAHFDLSGKMLPLNFSWREKSYKVASVGRNWEDEAGRHVLVMTPGDRVFELIFAPAENRWYLFRPENKRLLA